MQLTHLAVCAATAFAVVGAATGCGTNDTDHSAHAGSSAAAAPARTVTHSTSAATTRDAADPSVTPAQGNIVEDVNCGPVTDAGGGTRTVIAPGTPAGRVGCTEAINVATEYAQTVSNTDAQTVQGWQCHAQPDPRTPSACTKDGLRIELRAG
ncbi:hypothetical protein [Nocardia brasiliensis]|uniref:Lipoprotein n=1 Tax=Nocardia brasiliensis (strain ATCC 700358 / HUJEG-1) TaxID=1133849 RepID=K0F991_NOCB7|nr:hypothetical protein [Nocardia brasiliensis]AFU06277.1 hypothetical protein O3I_041660 [Nocardia brasiliensis ATCC 700358]OCF88550.1 hypothetical protein AW168_19645 [Nocardia brasiliensis]